MGRPFDPRHVLKSLSPRLVRHLFEYLYRAHSATPPVGSRGGRDFTPILSSRRQADQPMIADLQLILQDVYHLADARGVTVLDEEVAFAVAPRLHEFRAQEGRADRALWAFLHAPRAFEEAALFARADALSGGRHWQRRSGLPRVAIPATKAADSPSVAGKIADGSVVDGAGDDSGKVREHLEDDDNETPDAASVRLAAGLTAFYHRNQGRGRFCHVQRYTRANLCEYFFCYLDDYPDRKVVFDDDGRVTRVRRRDAFDLVFVFAAADGVLETYAKGGRNVQQPLQQTFCHAVLGIDVDPGLATDGCGDDPPYRLDHLLDPACPLPTRPEDAVSEVRIRRLRLEPLETPRRRVVLEADPKGRPDDVHHMIRRYLDARQLPPHLIRVTGASFQVRLSQVTPTGLSALAACDRFGRAKVGSAGRRAKGFSFDVAVPASCNLKGMPDEVRAIGERCLKLWGIANDA